MATEQRQPTKGFGEVSRTIGTIFRIVLLVATLIGIVALGILLAFVGYDAIQPQTADSGWYLVYGLTLVLPTAGFALYLHRTTAGGLKIGGIAVCIPALGVLFGGGLAMLFIDILSPIVWLDYLIAAAVPVVLGVAVERYRRLPFSLQVLIVGGGLIGSFAVVPGLVHPVTSLFRDWIAIFLTFALPLAISIGLYSYAAWESRRIGAIAAASVVGGVIALTFAGSVVGIDPLPASILAVTVAVPTGFFAVHVGLNPDNTARTAELPGRYHPRLGLLLPVMIVAGALVGLGLTELLALHGPESWVDWQFLTSPHRNQAANAGVYPAMVGSVMLMIIVAIASFPIGVGAAVYLEEYAPDNRITHLIDVNIANLAGVPSVVYGLLGLGLFVTYLGSEPGTVLVGGLTLALLILPIVIIAAREAIRSVPDSIRDASYGMGATRWQTIKNVVLPEAFPGILTGTILALGRAIGETAPLLVIGAPQVFDLPTALDARVGALPLQIFVWATAFAGPDFYQKALPAGVVVLLAIMITMNSAAIITRNHFEREA